MDLRPLPPKPSRMPPFWYLAALTLVLCTIAFVANFVCALDEAPRNANVLLAMHCGLMSWHRP